MRSRRSPDRSGWRVATARPRDWLRPRPAAQRLRRCDLGYLREAYRRPDGKVGYRCAAEPVDDHVRKGGSSSEAEGRQCLGNGVLATIGFGQTRRDGYVEPALITAGDGLVDVVRFVPEGARTYTAADVIDHLLQDPGGRQTPVPDRGYPTRPVPWPWRPLAAHPHRGCRR